MHRTISLDMDGVIVDSNPLHREAWIAFNRRYGLETTEAMLRDIHGLRNDSIVRYFYGDGLPPEEVAARGAAKEARYREMAAGRIEEMLVPGLRPFLDFYRGSPMAVASNAEPENVNFLLDGARLRGKFRVVVDGHQARHAKPHPEIYQRAAASLAIAPANCIVFEDSPTGVAAARAAGMRVVGIRTSEVDLPDADITADNFLNGCLTPWLRGQERVG